MALPLGPFPGVFRFSGPSRLLAPGDLVKLRQGERLRIWPCSGGSWRVTGFPIFRVVRYYAGRPLVAQGCLPPRKNKRGRLVDRLYELPWAGSEPFSIEEAVKHGYLSALEALAWTGEQQGV